MNTAILQEFEAIGVDLDTEALGKCELLKWNTWWLGQC